MVQEPTVDPTLPEVVQDFLRSGKHLEEIRLDASGQWTHEGLDFENRRVIDLFFRSVDRTDGGTWVLTVGHFTYPIIVEDVGFFITAVDWTADPPHISLTDGTTESLDLATVSYRPGGRLYAAVKEGAYRARFLRAPYHSLQDFFEARGDDVYLVHGVQGVRLGSLDDLES